MITESITPATGTCSHCSRADVPCLELGCSERDEGHRSVYSIRLELRVVVCVACLDAARERPAPVALPVLPATCGECEHYVPSHVAGTGDCSIITGSNQTTFATWSRPSHCPLRKGAA